MGVILAIDLAISRDGFSFSAPPLWLKPYEGEPKPAILNYANTISATEFGQTKRLKQLDVDGIGDLSI